MVRAKKTSSIWGFVRRFTIAHVLTYLIFGLFFMFVTRYFEYFESDPLLREIMRPADSPIVRLGVVLRSLRGALLGLAFYPFRDVIWMAPAAG